MTKLLEQVIEQEVPLAYGRVRDLACMPDGEISLIIKQTASAIISNYMRKRTKGKLEVSPALMDKYRKELGEASEIVATRLQKLFFTYRKRWEIARIEYPVLEQIVSSEMSARKIPYMFCTQKDENVLTVHVVDCYFLEIPLTMENVEKATRLIKYFLNRPDCAIEEMPEIRRVRNYRLARSWSLSFNLSKGMSI